MNNRAVSVADIMSTELTTVVPSTPLTQLLDVFAQHTFHHLPVVENDKLLGIISDRDLSQALSPTSAQNPKALKIGDYCDRAPRT